MPVGEGVGFLPVQVDTGRFSGWSLKVTSTLREFPGEILIFYDDIAQENLVM